MHPAPAASARFAGLLLIGITWALQPLSTSSPAMQATWHGAQEAFLSPGHPSGAPVPISPHRLVGQVVEQGFERPMADAVVTLYRQQGGEPEPVATTVSDEEGVFLFQVEDPGPWRMGAELGGLTSALSPPVRAHRVGPDSDGSNEELHRLVLPSPLLTLAASCEVEGRGAVVVGQVRDLDFQVPIPGARVEARWLDPELGEREQLTETDASGQFRVCGVTAPSELRLRAELLGRTGGWVPVSVPRPAVLLHDLAFSLATSTAAEADEIDWTGKAPSPDFGDLVGVLLDAETGAPVGNAVILVRGTPFQGVTTADGSFAFPDLRPGPWVLEVRHLGYALAAREIELPEGRNVRVTLRVAPRVLELEEVEVVARSAREQVIRTTPFRRYVVAGDALAMEESRGATLPDVVRRHLLGVRVGEANGSSGSQLCIETSRRIVRLAPDTLMAREPGPGRIEPGRCAMVQVIIDGMRIGDGPGQEVSAYLRSLPVSELESVEFLPPSHATLTWGTGGNVANGVLVLHTRGRGPYQSAARDTRPGAPSDEKRRPDGMP